MDSPFDTPEKNVVVMYLEPIRNDYYKTYQNIITLSGMPKGPLANMVKLINPPKLSVFQSFSAFTLPPVSGFPGSGCVHALMRYPTKNIHNSSKHSNYYMGADDIPSVISYLVENGYRVETDMTKMIFSSDVNMGGVAETRLSGNRKMICVVSYYPSPIII